MGWFKRKKKESKKKLKPSPSLLASPMMWQGAEACRIAEQLKVSLNDAHKFVEWLDFNGFYDDRQTHIYGSRDQILEKASEAWYVLQDIEDAFRKGEYGELSTGDMYSLIGKVGQVQGRLEDIMFGVKRGKEKSEV